MKHLYILLFTALSVGLSYGQEVMVNGGFESWDDASTPTGYSKAENTAQESTEVYSGTYSAKHTGGTKDIAQTVPIDGGQTYTISLWYKVDANSGDGTDARIWSNWKAGGSNLTDDAASLKGPNNAYLDNNNYAWTNYSVTLTAPATADELYFEVRTYKNAIVYWDDFSVIKQAVANPSIGISSPNDDAFVAGTDVDISLSVQNFDVGAVGSGDGHIHYSLDGGGTVMKYDTNPISLTNLSYGEHTLTAELVDGNHASLDPAVSTSVTFTTYKQQALPFLEEFDYPDGELSSADNWTVFSGTGYDIGVVSGKAEVKHAAGSGKDLFVSLPSVSGSIYYSFDLAVIDPGTGPIAGGDYEYFAVLKDDEYNYRARVDVVAPTATGDFTLGLSTKDSTADLNWASDLTYGQSYRVTVMYDQDSNISKLWVDATAESDTSITGTDQADPGTSITQFALRQSTSSVNETIHIDNLKIGETFDSTTLSDRLDDSSSNFRVYPNPVFGNVVNIISNNVDVFEVDIFSLSGKLIISNKAKDGQVNISNLNSGVYLINIESSYGNTTKKLIVN